LQLRLTDGPRVYLALSQTELALYFDSNLALHYDLEGRLVKVAELDRYWRRSLSGRVLFSRKLTAEEGGGLVREVVDANAASQVILDAHHCATVVHAALRSGTAIIELAKPAQDPAVASVAPVLELAARFDEAASERDGAQFRKIYGRVAVLPPDQYNAFVLQATEGCAYAGCTFCELYRNVEFHRKSPEEFRQHIRDAVSYHGESLRARRSIFLGEANALTQPTSMLKELFHILNESVELPPSETASAAVGADWWLGSKTRFDGVSSFLDAFTNPNRTVNDYRGLREAGLRRVYIGLETGDDGLLKWLKKPATAAAVTRTVQLLKEADIAVGVIVLLGAGGRDFATAHVRETTRVINELPLGRHDYVYFSPLVVYPGSQYDTQAMSSSVTPLTAEEVRQQEHDLRQSLRFDPRRGRPYLARYELETFVY
jgi:hypothetical protein